MPTINSLPAIASISGSEEFVINNAGTDNKCTATQITATVTTNLTAEIATRTSEVATLTTAKLALAGGTMTGDLVLAGAPTASLHAATKLYADGLVAGLATLASPALTGAPTAPTVTATATSGSTTVANTLYSKNDIYEKTNLKKTVLDAATLTLTTAHRGTIAVDYTGAGTCNITLPVISTLTIPLGYEYYIVDTGNNAGTNTITVTAGAGNTVDGGATTTITTDGESMLLANDGNTVWYIKDKDSIASATVQGKVELATTAEAALLTDTTRAVTAAGIGTVLDTFPYNITQLGSASHTLTAANTGTCYVTRTTTGACAITLPDPSTSVINARVQYAIYDAGTAAINNITITSAGGTIDGVSSFVINNNKMGATFFHDGTNWYSIANTQTAYSGGATTPWTAIGGITNIYFAYHATIGSTASPAAVLQLDQTSGDVDIVFSQAAAAKFAMGIDDTDDNWKISSGGTVGTGDILNIDDSNSHMGWGVAPDANTKIKVIGIASASKIVDVQNAAANVAFTSYENLTGLIGNGLSVGGAAPVVDSDGINVNGTAFTKGLKVEIATTGSSLIGAELQLDHTNAGYSHTALQLEASGADNNYALVTVGGNVGIGTATPAASALMDLTSTTGSLLLSRMTTTQRNALTAVNGMILYNSTLNKVQVYEGGAWASVI
jgi:hypothetical protein